jgi:ABC-type uncharacterized transport system substrate-binding protein
MIKKLLPNPYLIVFFYLSLLFSTVFSQEIANKKVLLLNSYHPEYTWTDEFTKGVKSQLNSSVEPEWLYIEYLDGRRMMDNKLYLESLVNFYNYKYAKVKFDAIISCDDYALEFLTKHKKDIFHDTPVIFGGINDMSKVDKIDYSQYTGVFEGLPIIENIDLIIKTQVGVNKIIILSDKTSQGIQVITATRELTKGWNNSKVKLEINDRFSFLEMKHEMEHADKNTAYLILVIIKDIKGRYFSFQRDLPVLSAKSKAPIYGMWGSLLIGNGIVGGYINDPYTHGAEIANITNQILRGKKTKDIAPHLQTIYKPRFDFRQMQKFGIDKKMLSKDAIVYYKPDSYYKMHKKIIDTVAVVFSVLIALIVLLTIIIKKQKKNNLQLSILSNQLQRSNEHLHQFSYMTSHQLRSSAVNIEMLLNYFKDELLDDTQKQWFWEKIDKTSLSMQNTVEDIAKILSIQKQKIVTDFKNVDIENSCNKILIPYKNLIDNGKLKVIFSLNDSKQLFTNENILIEIISVLIENAIKYNPNDRNLILEIITKNINKEIRLTIKDNGDGIPDGFEKKIFQLYQRGHENIEGKGLGLYVASLLAYSIQAKIEWQNLANKKGVAFTLIFKK